MHDWTTVSPSTRTDDMPANGACANIRILREHPRSPPYTCLCICTHLCPRGPLVRHPLALAPTGSRWILLPHQLVCAARLRGICMAGGGQVAVIEQSPNPSVYRNCGCLWVSMSTIDSCTFPDGGGSRVANYVHQFPESIIQDAGLAETGRCLFAIRTDETAFIQ
ncbi:hypothetical protein BD779DRAFT_1473073 [Infundibulicybe gibba]|nr:hypothetical protein BD779DRAFT_1473073 [Infundibulicybe gibba]